MKENQMLTNDKLDFLIEKLTEDKNKSLNVENFNIEITGTNLNNNLISNAFYDYFSFKVKTDLSVSSNDLNHINNNIRESGGNPNYKRISKCNSPDRLISHKFFEDTDNFRNVNLQIT
jgi:hypothetical protein